MNDVVRLVEVGQSTFNRRFRVELTDGAAVEAVLYRNDTLCVSSQVGCAVRCPFCASGAHGLARPLSFAELWGQVTAVRALGNAVQRTTISGVGEPLHNHQSVREFVLRCRAERIAPSLTTSGGPIERLCEWFHLPHNGLTLSVHAGSEAVRARMVPGGPTIKALYSCLDHELPKLTRARRKKIALAYLLIAGANDSDEELTSFAQRTAPLDVCVHLYAFNPVATSNHQPVTRAHYEHAYTLLRAQGLTVRMSSQARREENGGCGTLLALRKLARSPQPSEQPG